MLIAFVAPQCLLGVQSLLYVISGRLVHVLFYYHMEQCNEVRLT